MKKKIQRIIISFMLACSILISSVPVHAELKSTTNDDIFVSNENDAYLGERYAITINNTDQTLQFSGTTRRSYKGLRLAIYKIAYNGEGKGKTSLVMSEEYPLAASYFQVTADISSLMDEGVTYIIRPNFTDLVTETGYDFMNGRYQMTGAMMRVDKGRMHFLRYQEIEEQNAKVRETAKSVLLENYLDVNMRDSYDAGYGISNQAVEELRSFGQKLIQEKGAVTDYQKLLVFHDFIIENFYYDSTARNVDSIKATLNPIELLHQYKSMGKAKTVCDGYAAFFQVLARLQGIPCRTASGHNIILPRESWERESNIAEIDHVWDEAYFDANGDGQKEWVMIDCNADCSNTYTVEKGYQAPDRPVMRYTFFNPSAQVLAMNHRYIKYREKDSSYLRPYITSRKCQDGAILLDWEMRYRNTGASRTQAQDNNVAGYLLYRKTDNSGWELLQTFQTTDKKMSWVDETAKVGVKYYYRLAAVAKSDGTTGNPWLYRTAYAMATPEITDYSSQGNTMLLRWNQVEGADLYEIYRRISDPNQPADGTSTYSLLGVQSGSSNSMNVEQKDVKSGDQIEYRIVARKDIGKTIFRSSESVAVSTLKLDTPVLQGLVPAGGMMALSFSLVKGGENYAVYRSQTQDGEYERIGQISRAELEQNAYVDEQGNHIGTYYDGTAVTGVEYWYKVQVSATWSGRTCVSEKSLPIVTMPVTNGQGFIGLPVFP